MKYKVELTQICRMCNVEKPITAFKLNGAYGYRNIRCKPCVITMTNNGDKKTCMACDIEKPIDEFSTKGGDGLKISRCKLCVINKIYIPEEKKKLSGKSNYPTERLSSHLTKEDFKDTYIFLRDALGFDLKSKLSIHEQFCLKHNLTPHNPLNTFKQYYSIEECFNKKSI